MNTLYYLLAKSKKNLKFEWTENCNIKFDRLRLKKLNRTEINEKKYTKSNYETSKKNVYTFVVNIIAMECQQKDTQHGTFTKLLYQYKAYATY